MGDSARDEAYARANALYEQARAELARQQATLGVPPPDVVDDPDEPLLDESRIENPSYNTGHLVPRRKGDPILPWRMPWRRLRRKRRG